jgi:hypothetical protein
LFHSRENGRTEALYDNISKDRIIIEFFPGRMKNYWRVLVIIIYSKVWLMKC